MLPCDEQEQDRLDIFHKLITEARGGDGLIYAPHRTNGRFLDLGCGTGIWAIDVAQKYPDSHVVGVDLSRIQPEPENIPRNCDFYAPFDFEGPWSLGENSWDLIHMQLGWGSVVSWPSLYRRIHTHLMPDAWFEQVEIDWEPRCNDHSIDGHDYIIRWFQWLKYATDRTNRPFFHNPANTIRDLREAGFTDVGHQVIGLPLNPWHPDEHEKEVGRWYNIALCESVETLCLAPLTRLHSFTVNQVRGLVTGARSEIFNRDIHAYNLLHIYQARKPAGR